MFAFQNELAYGSSLPKWSPRARLGINLGPSSHHARNVYLVLNPHTGCASPQNHCRFDDFFETVRLGGPDLSIPTTWQRLAGLIRVNDTLSMEDHDDAPILSQRMEFEPVSSTPSFVSSALLVPSVLENDFPDTKSLFDPRESSDTRPVPAPANTASSPPSQAALLRNAGTSSRGRACTMSQAMAELVSQQDFFGKGNMHYMALQSTCEADYAREHDLHIELQEQMR